MPCFSNITLSELDLMVINKSSDQLEGTKKNFRWHITYDMLTIVNMKNRLRMYFSDLDNVENLFFINQIKNA